MSKGMLVLCLLLGFALWFFPNALAMADSFSDALEKGAQLYQSQKFDEAFQAFQEAAKSPDREIASMAYADLGICSLQKSDTKQAIVYFESALEKTPNMLLALENLNGLYFSNRATYAKGYELGLRAEKLFSNNAAVYYNMACYFGVAGNAAQALHYIDLAIAYGYEDMDYLAAEADFTNVRQRQPFKNFFAMLNEMKKVIDLYAQAEKQKAAGAGVEALKLELQTLEPIRKSLGKDSLTEATMLSSVASICVSIKRYPEALDYGQKAIAVQLKRGEHPDLGNAYRVIGNVYAAMKQWDNAIGAYQKAAELHSWFFGEAALQTRMIYNAIGSIYSQKNDSINSTAYFKKALGNPDELQKSDAKTTAFLTLNLAKSLTNEGDYAQAITYYEKSLQIQIAEYGPDSKEAAQGHSYLAWAYTLNAKYSQAKDEYEAALKVMLSLYGETNAETSKIYQGLGYVNYGNSQFSAARQYYDKALAILGKVSSADSQEIAQCLQGAAAVDYSLGNYEKATQSYMRAIAIWRKAGDPGMPEVAKCQLGLGAVAYTSGDYDGAIKQYQGALEIQLQIYGENNQYVAKNYLGLGVSYYSKGEFFKAIGFDEKAIAIQKKLFGEYHPDIARGYMNLSAVYSELGDTGHAIENANKCLDIQKKLLGEEHLDVSVTYGILGNLFLTVKDYKQAAACYQASTKIQVKILGKQHELVAESSNNIGNAFLQLGEYDQAIMYYRNALAIQTAIFGDQHRLLALAYLNLGDAYGKKKDKKTALEMLIKAKGISQTGMNWPLSIKVSDKLGLQYLQDKNYPEAEKSFRDGIAIIEKARREIGSDKADFMARNISVYFHSLQVSAAKNDLNAFFSGAESLKARGYLDRLGLISALGLEGIPADKRKKMLELNDQIESLADQRNNEMGKQSTLQDKTTVLKIINELQAKEREFSELDHTLMDLPSYRELRNPELASLADAKGMLKSGEAILEYVLSEQDKLAFCLIVTKSGVNLVSLDGSFDYTQQMEAWRNAIRDQDQSAEAIGARLFEKLIGPLDPFLKGISRLIVVPDASLAFLPFDALRKDNQSQYLCERFELSQAPSVSVLKMVNQRKTGPRKNEWFGLGDANYDSGPGQEQSVSRGITTTSVPTEKTRAYYAARGVQAYYGALGIKWKNLPGTREEVLNIADHVFGGNGVLLLTGSKASAGEIKRLSASGELAQQRLVHFACHGVYDVEYPAYSALVLSEVNGEQKPNDGESGYLTVEDIAQLKFNADLVSLSACETGLGTGYIGDGLVGLTRSFLVAGAKRVEVTLWLIDDSATKEFMVRFYELIKNKGLDYTTAMTQVKREFIKSGKYAAPYYWSGFVLYGM